MTTPPLISPVLNQAALEIRYRQGAVYFDRCGSTMLALEKELGAPFEPRGFPGMEYGELTSSTERLAVRYGPISFVAVQQWTERPTRLEQIAPRAWDVVSAKLDVERQVVRCGFRVMFQWRAAGLDEAAIAVKSAGLISSTSEWNQHFGEPKLVSLSGIFEDPDRMKRSLRTEITIVEQKVGDNISAELRAMVAPTAVQVDLDYVHPGTPFAGHKDGQTMPLGRGALKDFIRESWEDAKHTASRIGAKLGVQDHG